MIAKSYELHKDTLITLIGVENKSMGSDKYKPIS